MRHIFRQNKILQNKILLAGLLALGIAAAPMPQAYAQNGNTLLDLPPGHTVLNISATERAEVDQDILVATLRYEAENKDPTALQNEINTVMKKAVDAAEDEETVKVNTQQYYVYPHDRKPPRPLPKGLEREDPKTERIWRGSQSLQLRSESADDLLELTGKLQEMGLVMNGLSYRLSSGKREETRDSLMEAALQKIMAKAGRAATALGKTSADMIEVSVDTNGGYHPGPVMRTMAMDSGGAEAMAAPVAAAGQTDITLTVNARVLLKP